MKRHVFTVLVWGLEYIEIISECQRSKIHKMSQLCVFSWEMFDCTCSSFSIGSDTTTRRLLLMQLVFVVALHTASSAPGTSVEEVAIESIRGNQIKLCRDAVQFLFSYHFQLILVYSDILDKKEAKRPHKCLSLSWPQSVSSLTTFVKLPVL